MKEGRFREDLFYRLSTFPVYVPPLRDRKEDIPLLARHFLKLYTKKMDKPIENFPTSEIEKLMQYSWPGNVRELENVIERGIILNKGSIFRVPNLDQSSDYSNRPESEAVFSLQENERRHILKILQQTRWKICGNGGAAELLEIHPSTLRSRMKKLDIVRGSKLELTHLAL